VERIEKIKQTDIEHLGGKRVIKYRGGTLPLFSIDEVAMVKPLADMDNMLVVVFNVAKREVGLLAMGPVDAQEINLTVDGVTLRQEGIMGSAIINDNTTLLVDIYEIVKALNPQWFDTPWWRKPMAATLPRFFSRKTPASSATRSKAPWKKRGLKCWKPRTVQLPGTYWRPMQITSIWWSPTLRCPISMGSA
jgi:chemotaxis signal transduction protein